MTARTITTAADLAALGNASAVPEAAVEALDALVEIAKVGVVGSVRQMVDDLAKDVRAALTAAPSATREGVARAIRSVTDRWDEPLDEVHDVPPIADALLARFTITPKEDR